MAYNKTPNPGYERLKEELRQKSPGNFYIFTGEEAYLRSYYLQQLQKLVLDEATADFNFHRFSDENLTAEALDESKEALPMMAERSLVLIEDVNFFDRSEEESKKYAQALSDIPPYCTMILLYNAEPYKPDRRKKVLTKALDRATLVEFRRQSESELCSWITRHFRAEKKTISNQLCAYLVQITDGLMSTLQSEISKISAHTQAEQITKADIDAVVEPVPDAVVFDLSDAIADGNYELALKKLRQLQQLQQEPIAILGSICTQLRRILTAKTLAASGQGKAELASLCGISEYPAKKITEFARKLPDSFCDNAVLLCLQTDYQMKTSFDDVGNLLELLILRLAQEARNA